MDARLQKRVQRYGWDRAAASYADLWGDQLRGVQDLLLQLASPAAGQRVLDVACGTGVLALACARAVGPAGQVLGVDLSEGMVIAADGAARAAGLGNVRFARMDAESLALPPASFDLVVCGLGLMYCPDPIEALRQMRAVLKDQGRIAVSVWGPRARCAWAPELEIVDSEVKTEVCPLFFALGATGRLRSAFAAAGFSEATECLLRTTLDYESEADACDAALIGGPVALAWGRFTPEVQHRVRERYGALFADRVVDHRYRLPVEFVLMSATA
ncbi:MAG: class I SAM-dependent methyltransferase [Betaproteobacteria bacterium]